MASGRAIPIEERDGEEVTHIHGLGEDGRSLRVRLAPEGSGAANPGFDITPARLVTAFITDQGLCPAEPEALADLFSGKPEA